MTQFEAWKASLTIEEWARHFPVIESESGCQFCPVPSEECLKRGFVPCPKIIKEWGEKDAE